MKRRSDRRTALQETFYRMRWPFTAPTWFDALDGSLVPRPRWWMAGGGAWGCMLSHRRVLESAINDGIDRLLVMEDDVYFVDGFAEKVAAFLANVPSDWEQLMIGGQFVRRGVHATLKETVAPGVLRVHGVERTHCYAVRGRFLRDLYLKWSESSGHCDHVMGPFQFGRKVYAPETFLAGQSGGRSDIAGRDKPPERWVEPSRSATVWLFRTAEAIEAVRGKTHHAGYTLTEDRMDKGWAAIKTGVESQETKISRIRHWVDMIEREAISRTPECEPAIFDPNPDIPLLTAALGERLQLHDQPNPTSLPTRRVYWKAKCGA